jgi:hypothetical protein
MKRLLCVGLALTALATANVGTATASSTADSAYTVPPENSSPPATNMLATTTADKMKSTPHSSVCTCCNCAMATIEDTAKVKSAITTANLPAPPYAKPGVVIYDSTVIAYGMREGKVGVGLVASFGESQGGMASLISTAVTADANSLRPGGVALGKLGDGETTAGGTNSATSGNSNAPQLLAGVASLTCAPPGITFKV